MVDRSPFCLVAALFCGCSADTSVFLSFPPRGDDIKTVVVAVEEQVPELSAFAVGPDEPPPPLHLPLEDNAVKVSVLYYRDTLETLHLEEGKVLRATDTDCTPYSLTEPVAHYEITARSEGVSPWQERDQLSEPLKNTRFLGPCVCTAFDVQVFDTGSSSVILALAPLDDQTVLAVSYEKGAPGFLVRRDGLTPIDLQLPASAAVRSAFTDAEGTVWLGGTKGRLWYGRPGTGFTETQTSTTVTLSSVDGAKGTAPFELYFSTEQGTLERFDGQWETIHAAELLLGSGSSPSVVWLGEGHLLATIAEQESVIEIRRGIIRETDWDTTSWSYPEMLGMDGDGRIISASYHGRFVRYLNGRWTPLEGQSVGRGRLHVILPLSNGFFFAGRDAVMGTYQEPQGLCGTTQIDAPISFVVGVPLGNGYLLAGGPFGGHSNKVALFTPR